MGACRVERCNKGRGQIERPQDAANRHAPSPPRHRTHADPLDRRRARAHRARDGADAARAAPGRRLKLAFALLLVSGAAQAAIEPGNWEFSVESPLVGNSSTPTV